MKKIIIGTNNKHKKEKLSWIIEDFFEPTEMPNFIDIDENGKTFEDNACVKAKAIAIKFDSFAIATDGGAVIKSLGDQWNPLMTKRFIDKKIVSDWVRIETLLSMMKDKIGEERTIKWREAIAISNPKGEIIFSSEVDGDTGLVQETYKKERYRDGIWLYTLWSYPQFGNKNFFDLNEDEIKEGEISWWRLKENVHSFYKNMNS